MNIRCLCFCFRERDRGRKSKYRVGCGVGFAEKRGLSEITDIEGSLVLENVEVVVIFVLEN